MSYQADNSNSQGRGTPTTGLKIALAGGGKLLLASTVTLSLLFGMVLALLLALIFIVQSPNPTVGLFIAIALTVAFNLLSFFFSPILMDLMQRFLYGTQWVSITDIESKSPETAELINRICEEQNLQRPRLGIIDDENPTAFTYGSLPNNARLVVTEGLFTYLDDDEVATVYAHEMGHIVNWDFAVMTLANTLVQITYFIYVYATQIQGDNDDNGGIIGNIALAAYVFYMLGTYILLYLSRTREYLADHFATERTGNPNALSRALVKIAYGIVEEGQKAQQPSRVLQGTRALGIYDGQAASSTATAYRVAAEPTQVGRVFLWDLFNPWAWLMELNSTHPLTGKRVRALSTYAEQLGLEQEFNMGEVINEGNNLNKKRLYGNFVGDIFLYLAPIIGVIAGLIISVTLVALEVPTVGVLVIVGSILLGWGFGKLFKTMVQRPSFKNAVETDVLTLMSNPYASPLRGKPVKLQGELIGRGDAGYAFGSDLKLQDSTGLMFLHYASRFGPLGNFLFGMKRVKSLIGMSVESIGWFYRGMIPWTDLIRLKSDNGTVVNSYHRFWSFVLSIGAIALGIILVIV